jgi:hypothetical protein
MRGGVILMEQTLEVMTVEDISAAVTAWAAGEPLVRRVYLFGSRATGTSRPDSIDCDSRQRVVPALKESRICLYRRGVLLGT